MKKNNFFKFVIILFVLFPAQQLKSEVIIMSLCDDQQDEFIKNEYILNLNELIMTRNYIYKEKTYQKYPNDAPHAPYNEDIVRRLNKKKKIPLSRIT